MIDFAKNGQRATHVISRLDLTGGRRGKGQKWQEVVKIAASADATSDELRIFILTHEIATDRELRRQKVKASRIHEDQIRNGHRMG
jgi:hypothetical protein